MKTINNICIILILSLLSMSCESKKNTANAQSNVCVEMKTTLGNITVKLYNETPAHRDNFIKLVKFQKHVIFLLRHLDIMRILVL